jgi:30S ribosomal protein S31
MGKGDIKTKRGKIANKSYGVRRPTNVSLRKNKKQNDKLAKQTAE